MKIKILLDLHGKYSKKKFRYIDLFDFTSFLVRTFYNFLARRGYSEVAGQLLLEGRINVRRIDKPQENRTVKGIFSLSSLINIRLMSVPAAAKSKAVLCTVCIYGEVVQPKRRNTSYYKDNFEKPLQLPQDVFGNNYYQRYSWHHCRNFNEFF